MWHRALLITLLSAAGAFGQTAPPAFAVVSVKRNTTVHNGIGNKFGPDSARWTNVPLENLIESAYRLYRYQVAGGPGWIQSDRWDIDAKAEGPISRDQMKEMLGTLLADRFQLRFHREIRQMPVYQLTVAKGGPKFAAARPQTADHRWGVLADQGLLEMSGATMPEVIDWLSLQLDQPVEDHTGLTGTYDFRLAWAQDLKPANGVAETPSNSELPIASALESELGLKMTVVKGPVEILVIDRVERASEN